MENIKDILAGIGIPLPAQKIYVSLLKEGKASARTLAHRTGITRTSVYDQLRILRKKDLIIERLIEGTNYYEIGDVRKLSMLLDDRVEKLSAQQDYLAKNIASLIDKSGAVQPKIRFFEGSDGVKQLFKDILWYDDTTLYLYWPYAHMLDFLGKEFLFWFSTRRKAHNIPIKTIWGHATGNIKNHIFVDDGKDVERKYLIQKNIPSMGFMIYDKKVAFVSSHKESFGFIVESAEFSCLQKMQFDVLWEKAKRK
jgi:predicted transcriptional regulator